MTLYNEVQARTLIPMSLHWFRRGRWRGTGPKFLRIGSRVFYRKSELLRFLKSREQA
jgi:hypothetical protein